MNLKKGLFTLIFMIGTLCLTYGQAPSYPWLDGVVSDNCCSNQTATAYDFGTYSFVYIEANGECTPGGKLYFEDGTCWCVDKDGTSCLDFYIPSSTTGQEIYNCEGAVNFTPFDQFDWLSGIANAQDCSANPAITVYLRSGQHFIHVLGANGLGQLYSQSGRALCSDQENYSCRTAYNLSASNQTLSWTCGEGAGTGNVADITMRNTLQDPGEAEATYASLFGAADDAYDEFATFSATASEFPTALAQPSSVTGLPFNISGLYDIDITASTIDFTLLPDENDPFWIQQFGVFPAGKFDRYYLTFAEPHGIIGGSSTNGSVNLRVDSENVVVVELSEGYNFNPGMAFTINLIKEGSIVMRNTLQDPGEAEATYASLFGAADDAYDEFATFSATASEFPTALAQPSSVTGLPFNISGLYDIDITASTIDFTLLPDETDPFWIQQFGVFPAGKFDRYYLTFAEPHNIVSGSSTNGSVNLRVDSENVVVVELSEGYDFNPGMAFTINLIKEGSIVMRNTLQDPGEVEATYASLFGAADDAYDEFATFSATASEFPTALAQPSSVTGLPFNISGLYDIDITASTIDFTLLPDETDPFWIQQFGVFPAGKFDRYYLTFAEPHNIVSGSSTNGSVNLRVDSETVVVVELSEGYDFNPGMAFTINLNKAPLNEGNNIVLRNTLQDPGEAEATYASLFGAADDAYDENGTLSNSASEFPTALAQPSSVTGLPFDISGLYDINFTGTGVEFTLLPDETDPFWIQQFGVFPAGKFDRYYFTFDEPHNITSAASNNSSVNLRIDSDKVIVVEISEGYDFNPGISFFINFNMADGLTNLEKALGFNQGLETGDPAALIWMRDDYIQHNVTVPTGKAGIAAFYTGQPIGLTIDINRAFQAGDYVFAQTTFGGSWGAISGSGNDQIIYDVWRFEDGFAVEHWDNIGDVVDDMDGTSQTDGVTTPVTDLDKTDANKALLEEMAQTLFVNGDWTNVRDYFDIDNYVQHSVGAGPDGAFLASLEGQTGVPFYDAVKFVHVSGNFGLVMSEGPDITGQDPTGVYAYYDLFRMENGKIVEHWDIIEEIPPMDQWVNSNGKWGDNAISGDAENDSSTASSIVLEVTTFNLNEGVDPSVFEARDAEILEDFTQLQPGYLKRMSGATSDGKYLVLVLWETLADADASITAFGMDPTVADYFGMIDGSTFSAQRYTSFTVPDIEFALEKDNVIEIATYNINDGVDPADFAARDGEVERDFSSLQPGFIRRTSGVNADDQYSMIVFWESLADADASISVFGMDPSVADFFGMIDGNTFVLDRYTVFGSVAADGASTPLKEGMDITLRNTLQDAGEAENTYASLFGAADDAFDEFATLSNSTSEFPTALSQSPATGAPFDIAGLYDIDLTENSISFKVLPDETDMFWTGVFGLFPEGKVDRYYLTFSEPHNITGFTSDNPFLNVRIDSENVIVVELTGGYDLKPGVSFTVNLN